MNDFCKNHDEIVKMAKEALESAKSAHHRISKNEDQLDIMYQMSTNLSLMAKEQKIMSECLEKVVEKLDTHEQDINILKNRPAATALMAWQNVGKIVTTALISSFITALIAGYIGKHFL